MALFGTVLVLLDRPARPPGRARGARRRTPTRSGLVAAGIAAISPNIWVNDGLVMSETLTGVAVVGACLLAFALWDRPNLLARRGARACAAGS